MNAVATKPRAKAKPKAAKSGLQMRLKTILSAIAAGRDKLETAHMAAAQIDLGEPVEMLLRFVLEVELPRALAPLEAEPLTRDDMDAAYTGMFPSLAALEGVIALACGNVIESTVREAHALLDAANSAMDFADMGDVLPHRADTIEANFNRGRDLAVAMLEVADDLQMNEPDTTSPYRAYRYGKPQARFTEAFLLQLIADPSMLDGFNAVLSAKLGDQCDCPASYYIFSMAEYSGGSVGDDGTMSDPLNQEPLPTGVPA
jgi:hypothetical protein